MSGKTKKKDTTNGAFGLQVHAPNKSRELRTLLGRKNAPPALELYLREVKPGKESSGKNILRPTFPEQQTQYINKRETQIDTIRISLEKRV